MRLPMRRERELIRLYRFSKLFMSHLDTEFQKQANDTLRHLVADQVRIIVCTISHLGSNGVFVLVPRASSIFHGMPEVWQSLRTGYGFFRDRT